MAKVAIILPTYHRPVSLENAIQSVLRQTFKAWRLYIIGDGCTDNTEKLVKRYKRRNPEKIVWHNLPQNHGGQHTNKIVTRNDTGACPRNTAFFMSEEPWICYLDDDDAYRKDHIHFLYNAVAGKNYDFAFTQGAIWRRPNLRMRRPRIVGGPMPAKARLGTNSLIHSRRIANKILIPKTDMIKVPSTRKVYKAGVRLLRFDCCKEKPGILWLPAKICDGCHDWDLIKRMLDVGARWKFIPKVTYDIYWDMNQVQFKECVLKNKTHRQVIGWI